MSAIDSKPFPKGALVAVGCLLGACLLLVSLHQLSERRSPSDPHAAYASVEAEDWRLLRFVLTDDGGAVAYDGETGEGLGPIGEADGFIRAVVSGLLFERRKRGLSEDPVYELVRWTDGRLSLEDVDTQIRVNLGAFGITFIKQAEDFGLLEQVTVGFLGFSEAYLGAFGPDGKRVFARYLSSSGDAL